jgi:hypothetical protein
MPLPTQIDERLKALGVRAEEVEETFVRGAGPGGRGVERGAGDWAAATEKHSATILRLMRFEAVEADDLVSEAATRVKEDRGDCCGGGGEGG